MTAHPLMLFIFILGNLAITLGYLYLAFRVVPRIRLTLKRTIYGGIGFFLLCGATHTDLALMALFSPDMTFGQMAGDWPMLLIHVPQAICVWLFVTGLYIEVGAWAKSAQPTLDPDRTQH